MRGALVLAVLLLPGALRAQQEPGSDSPSSGNCGQPASLSADELRAHIEKVLYKGYGVGAAALTQVSNPPPLVFDDVRNTKMAFLEDDGSKPTAVHYNRALCDIAASDAEVVFILAHELMHVKLKHVERLKEHAKALKDGKCRGSESCLEQERNAFMLAREDDADDCAEKALARGGTYSPAQAAAARKKFMQHLQDLYWVINAKGADATHRAPAARQSSAGGNADCGF